MDLLRDYLIEERAEIMENEIRLQRHRRDSARCRRSVRDPLDALMADSADNSAMVLTLALSYGGRESIAEAARAARWRQVAAGELERRRSRRRAVRPAPAHRDLPPLDLVIRTSGEQRISNFLLWEAAYAELYFSPAMWPDFRRQELYAALDAYAGRERRFGLTGSQIESGGDLAP